MHRKVDVMPPEDMRCCRLRTERLEAVGEVGRVVRDAEAAGQDEEAGRQPAERSPEALAKPIVRLLQDESLRRKMGEAGFVRCTENFEVHKTIGQLEAYYESLLRRK